MVRTRHFGLVAATLLAGIVVGCGGGQSPSGTPPETSPATPDALLKQWFDLAQDPAKNLSNPGLVPLGIQLYDFGPQNILPLVEVLADPARSTEAKVMAVATLGTVVAPELIPRLTELAAPENPADTRACATQLLGQSGDPSVIPTLKARLEDSDKRVRLSALVGLMALGDDEARKVLAGQLNSKDLHPKERARILLSFLSDARPEDLPMLQSAALDTTVPRNLRVQAIATLGRLADRSMVEALRQCGANAEDDELRQVAQDAITAIEARNPT